MQIRIEKYFFNNGLNDKVDDGRCYGLDTSSGSGSMGSSSGYGSTGFEPNLDDTLGKSKGTVLNTHIFGIWLSQKKSRFL